MHFITTTTFLALMPALLSSLALGAAVPATDVTALDDVPLGIVAAKPLPIGKSLTKRYSSGQCNIHVHHWKNVKGIDMVIEDAVGNIIGNIARTVFNNNRCISVSSQLPWQVVACPMDDNQIQYSYGADSWTTLDGRCSVGGYQDSDSQMDCYFSC